MVASWQELKQSIRNNAARACLLRETWVRPSIDPGNTTAVIDTFIPLSLSIQVFEDAFEDAVEEHDEPKEQSSSSSNNKKIKNPISKRLSSMRDKRKHRQKQRELQRKEDENTATGNENSADTECAPIPMAEAIEEAKLSVDLFLSNKFEDAKNVVEPL